MMDFAFVTDRLAVGGYIYGYWNTTSGELMTERRADAIPTLQRAGITHVLCLQEDIDDAPLFNGSPIAYSWAPTPDDGLPKLSTFWSGVLQWGLRNLAEPKAKLLVHCAAGASRAPSAAYGILRAFGMSNESARSAILNRRPQAGHKLTYEADIEDALRSLGYAE